jgi:hypothetical protein
VRAVVVESVGVRVRVRVSVRDRVRARARARARARVRVRVRLRRAVVVESDGVDVCLVAGEEPKRRPAAGVGGWG